MTDHTQASGNKVSTEQEDSPGKQLNVERRECRSNFGQFFHTQVCLVGSNNKREDTNARRGPSVGEQKFVGADFLQLF